MKRPPELPWLDPAEQEELVGELLRHGLIRFSNSRDLPLKSGGKTDVYINLRDARNDPEAIQMIARLAADPLRRLRLDRFVEVPDSVSTFAGPISIETGLPYLTIREQPKTGRVAKAKVIGSGRPGERVAIFDDVITDGASKVDPYRECRRMMLDVAALVVLVDRQQGWRENFVGRGIDLPVWPGMTLHDVRRILIQTLGVMKRCDPALEAMNPITVALDGKDWGVLLPVIDELRTAGCILKVNDLLTEKGAEWLLPNLSVYGRVMADLKGHDIPNTLKNHAARLRKHPPWAVTVHASGHTEMIRATVKAFEGTPTKVLAVTVLTSLKDGCREVYHRIPWTQARDLAKIAAEAGAHGFVCSTEEVGKLRKLYPKMTLVTPGIRSPGKAADDQKRVGTPRGAIEAGSNYLVMGRQIFGADDPVAEVHRILREELTDLV